MTGEDMSMGAIADSINAKLEASETTDVNDAVENEPGARKRGKRTADPVEPQDDLVTDGDLEENDDDVDGDDDRAAAGDDTGETDETELEAGDDTGEGDEDGEGGEAPDTLEALAEQLGTPVDDMLDTIKHTVKVDGEDVAVSLGELVRSHEGMGHVNERLVEVEAQRDTLNKAHKTAAEDYQAKVGRLGAVLQATEQALMSDANSPAMQHLRATNPAEWSARMQEFQARQGQVQRLFGDVAQEWDAHRATVEEKRKGELAERVTTEGKKIKAAIPKWDKTYETSLMSWIASAGGFSKAELEADPVIDHRMLVIADKARKYDALVAKGKTKKAAPAAAAKGKTLNPVKGAGGTAPSETTTTTGRSRRTQRELVKARKALKKSGSMNDAADVFNQRLGVQ